jgi:hypothetical protein
MSEQVKKWIVIHNKYLPFVDDIVSEKNFFSGVELLRLAVVVGLSRPNAKLDSSISSQLTKKYGRNYGTIEINEKDELSSLINAVTGKKQVVNDLKIEELANIGLEALISDYTDDNNLFQWQAIERDLKITA